MEGKFNCACVDQLNEALAPLFYYVDRSLMLNIAKGGEWEVMLIPLGKYDPPKGKKRARPPRIIMKFCPICGVATGDIST